MDEFKSYLTPLSKKIKDLEAHGYTAHFKFQDNSLFNSETKESYGKEKLRIANKYRFEGESNPSDEAILYALETNDGNKGTLVNAYGTYADKDLDQFLQGVEDNT